MEKLCLFEGIDWPADGKGETSFAVEILLPSGL